MADRSLSVRLRAEVDQFRKDMAGAAKSVAGVGEAAGEAGQQRKAIELLGRTGREVGRTVAAAAGLAAAGVAAIGVQALRTGVAYNSLEQSTRVALTTLLGSAEAAEQQMDSLREFVETRMFPREAFIEGQQRLLAFGLEAERVIPTLGAVEDAVIAAGGSAVVFGEVVGILADIQSTGRITATELRELGRRGINAAQLIGDAMGQTEVQIRESITSGALDGREAIELLVEAMGTRFAGAAESLAQTWVGATGLISAGLRNIGSTAVEAFIDPRGGGAAVQWANDVALSLQALNRQLRPLVDELRQRAGPTFALVSERLQALADRIDELDLVGFVAQVRDGAPVLAAFGAAAAAAGSSAALSAVGLGSLASTITPLGAGITALVATSPELRAELVELLRAVAPLVPTLAELATILAGALTTGLNELLVLASPIIDVVAILVDTFGMLPEPIQQTTLALGALTLALRFGGPVGVALSSLAVLGAAVETLGVSIRTNESDMGVWRSTIAETADDLERLGRTGRRTGDIVQAREIFQDFAEALEDARDELNAFERIQKRLADIPPDWMPDPPWKQETPQIRETSEVLAEFQERFSTVDQALADMVSSGNADTAADAFERLALMADMAGIPHDRLIELFPEYARQLERHRDATGDAADSQGDLADEVDRATQAMREQHDEIRAQVDPMFALIKSVNDLESAQDHYNEVLEDSESTQADVEAAALSLAQAALELQGAAGDAAGAFDGELDPAFRSVLQAAGLTEGQIDLVEQAMKDAAEAGEEFSGDYVANLIANGVDNTLARIELVRQRLANIDRTVTISFETQGFAPVGSVRIPGMQHGGPVVGPSGIDRVPAMLTAGEHVLTVDEVTALGGHEAVASLRAMALAGATRFAVGGPVGVARQSSSARTSTPDPTAAGWTVQNMNINMPTARVSPRAIAEEFAFHAAV